MRTYEIELEAQGGGVECEMRGTRPDGSPQRQSKKCGTPCEWTWSEWTPCDRAKDGTRRRELNVTQNASLDGKQCPNPDEVDHDFCDIDCVGEWDYTMEQLLEHCAQDPPAGELEFVQFEIHIHSD